MRLALIGLLFLGLLPRDAAAHGDAAAMALAVHRWQAVQQPTGLLPYGFDFLADRAREPDTPSGANLARQAYTAAVWAQYYALTSDSSQAPGIRRYLQALGQRSRPIGKRRLQSLLEATHLLSLPVGRYKLRASLQSLGLLYDTDGPGRLVVPPAGYGEAYSAATSLALVAELRYFAASGDDRFAALRRAWLDGLLSLRIAGDGFRLSPLSIDTTPYFDGEAWLALATYNRLFPHDSRAADAVADLDDALLRKYGDGRTSSFFHWGAMAAAARFAVTADPRLGRFIAVQTRAFLDSAAARLDKGDNPCPLAEGVIDALRLLRHTGQAKSDVARRARAWLAPAMEQGRTLQIQPGQTELTLPGGRIEAPAMKHFAGAFRSGRDAADTQIDLTAHCVSAMVKLTRLDAGAVP